ncbi:allene oxide cyclase barrel-like domain-containing protein [Streptosporangium longisporum]|uniref:Allene oxide cyclase barrel-like domain-containing protein n=1 Tax=Streptosporangium longisporum TaxID=46187 RepID=A0ABP6KA39_9ACTN
MDFRVLSARVSPVLDTVSSWALPLVAAPPETTSERVGALGRPGRSLILRDLTEKVVEYHSNNPDPTGTTPTEKDVATVRLEIFGPDGEPLGHTSGAGRMLYRQEHDGHFIAYFGEEIRLRDGNVIRSGGLVDDARLTAGEAATFPAVVVSGPLRGAIGFRQFRPLVKDAHDTYESSIVVYLR